MRQTIKKWGNSLALRLPASVAEAARLSEDQEVDVSVDELGKIVVVFADPADDFDYDKFVEAIRFEDVPQEIDIGEPRGPELGGSEDPYCTNERRSERLAV
ncbi:AbrB/MazE/SpoVT family DNA-binding domain-containing protein [Burkholderia vietnamiensis]|uniref:AbrB/MazE/SpoVT family DNA-binding domain-containing protein n=1 Tax=Burkholderia vietnamiensis TaxID=60552 RepID=UPI0039B482CD